MRKRAQPPSDRIGQKLHKVWLSGPHARVKSREYFGVGLMQRRLASAAGFSLLELLAVVTIIGIIAAMAISRVSAQAFDAKKKCCLQYTGDLNSAIEHFHFDRGGFPTQLSELEGEFYPEAIPACPVTNLPYQIDASSNRIQGHNH